MSPHSAPWVTPPGLERTLFPDLLEGARKQREPGEGKEIRKKQKR